MNGRFCLRPRWLGVVGYFSGSRSGAVGDGYAARRPFSADFPATPESSSDLSKPRVHTRFWLNKSDLFVLIGVTDYDAMNTESSSSLTWYHCGRSGTR